MNKGEFLHILRENLKNLPEEELENAIRYYSEYIDDAENGNPQEIIRELGDPAEIARQILAEGAADVRPASVQPVSRAYTPVWVKILIAVLLFPVWIGPFAAILGVTLAFCCVALAFVLCLPVLLVGGIVVCFSSGANGVLTIGTGLAIGGLGGLLSVGMYYTVKYECKGMAALCRLIFTKGEKKA